MAGDPLQAVMMKWEIKLTREGEGHSGFLQGYRHMPGLPAMPGLSTILF
jgi:hypothetical protein